MVYHNLEGLVLASHSPRRRELLGRMGIGFTVCGAAITELRQEGENYAAFSRRMALEKAANVVESDHLKHSAWILAADTIVVCQGQVFGKPADWQEAQLMLSQLAGQWHQVLTAYTLLNRQREIEITRLDRARVKIMALSQAMISAYVADGEPLDKAGAYAMQGLGGSFVESVEGCPSTVIGLPMPLVCKDLLAQRVIAVNY